MTKNGSSDHTEDVEVVKDAIPDSSPAPTDNNKLVLARDIFPPQLPVIPVSNRPLFPKMTVPLMIDDDNLKKLLVDTAKNQSRYVGLFMRKITHQTETDNASTGLPKSTDLFSIGVMAEILQMAQPVPGGPIQILLGCHERIRMTQSIQDDPYIVVAVTYLYETELASNPELKAYSISLIQAIKELVKLNPLHKEELSLFLSQTNLAEPGRLSDFAAAMTTSTGQELQDILETVSVRSRLGKVLILIRKEINVSRIQMQINKQIEEKLSNQQRQFFLREQLKAIKKELGLAKEDKETEVDRFAARIEKLKLTDEARERIAEEMEKLKLLEPSSPEFNVTRNYLDWLTILPWGVFTRDSFDVSKAGRILNRDHYGLDDVKERILEFLSVGILKGNISGSILCFVGPPGVGKTSLGQSIARSIGRNFFRFSLGGIRDEAEIKGHRRTYIGALPGKFIQTMRTCKSANPVIMLDEIDKINASFQGDPASALLEVLDPEQNRDFLDHYLDVRFDLSNVFFICTANQQDTIPRPLLDRMEIIPLAGYIQKEKLEIARRYVVPKQLKAHGLSREQFTLTNRAINEIIEGYAREPGVRSLENHIKKVMRKSVKKIVGSRNKRVRIDAGDVASVLGKRVYLDEDFYKTPMPGVVRGLAWTSMGGDTLHIEATSLLTDNKPGLKQTGQLGNVMLESSEIAYTYVRSLLDTDPRAREFFQKRFIHLHVPAGATPKDGPSAGITMAMALYSLAQNRPVRRALAMTGELTLTGKVMPIGGVKEKTIAAKRAGVENIIFPWANQKDFEELPSHIRKGLRPHFVKTFPEVVAVAMQGSGGRRKRR